MCSRYTSTKDRAALRLREQRVTFSTSPRASIRPTDPGPVILPDGEGFACRELRWGWTVPWDKSPLINAKSETLLSLPTFRPHLQQRCLLLTDGFYEKGVLFRQCGAEVFCLAGLWREEAGVVKYTMLTTTPNATVAKYHARMPFILRPDHHDGWLGGNWQAVLMQPDHAPLEIFQNQPELF